MNLDTLQALLGWSLVINMALYTIWVLTVLMGREWLVGKHCRWFGIDPGQARATLYLLLGLYKILITGFLFVPWLAVLIVNR